MSWLGAILRRAKGGDREGFRDRISGIIQDAGRPDLDELAKEFGVGRASAAGILAEVVRSRVSILAHEGISRGSVDLDRIHQEAVALGLDAEAAKKAIEEVVSNHFTVLVSELLDDGILDPEEDARIASFLAMIGSDKLSPETAAMLDEARRAYTACTAPLTPREAPVLLKKGEYCVFCVSCEALEDRSRTVRVGYSGPSARIRVAKGIYYNAGSLAVERYTEEYQHSFGVGVLCLTNKRLLWISEQKSISIPISNVVRYDPYSDGIRIMKGTGKPLLFMWTSYGRPATIMTSRVLEEMR